jgi:hypothetical protein
MHKFRLGTILGLALLLCAGGGALRHAGADGYVPPASPPPEFQAQYNELSQELTTFEAQLDADWDGSVGPGQFAGALAAANGNKTLGLLGGAQWTHITQMLDAYEAMGVRLIKLDVQYPVLTPAFHTYLAAHPPPAVPNYTFTAQNFIGTPNSFYNKLVTEIRSRGMGVWIEHGTLFADYTPTPATGYFADMRTAGLAATQARYTQERTAESEQIVSQLKPDYYTVLEEPNTADMNFGYFPGNVPIFDPDGWTSFVQSVVAEIDAAAPNAATLVGAGVGTWDGTTYLTRLAPLPELDYFDMHIYPLKSLTTDYLQTTLAWADYVHSLSPTKGVMIGEAWTWKTTAAEVSAGADFNEVYGRDVYSFWEPIDRQFLEVLFKLMQYKGFIGVMPFWSQYYFAYLTYGDPDLDGLSPIQLLAADGAIAQDNWATMTLTGTGQKLEELLAIPQDADGDGTPDSADTGDSDGDGTPDNTDACPTFASRWPVPAGDGDCDGYPDTVKAGSRAAETAIGTRPGSRCATTADANDEPLADDWPVDFNDDQLANGQDILKFNPLFGTSAPGPPYKVRFDLNADGVINGQDILQLNAFFGKFCAP